MGEVQRILADSIVASDRQLTDRQLICSRNRELIVEIVGKFCCQKDSVLSRTFARSIAATFFFFYLLPALAQPFVELAPNPANVSEYPIKIGVPGLSAEIRLQNSSKEAVRYLKLGPMLTRSADGLTQSVTWTRIAPPGNDNAIPAGAQVVLQLSADLQEPGIYETYVDAYGKDDKGAEVPDRRIRIVITREADPIPAEFLSEPKPATEDWPWNSANRTYTLTMRNTGTKTLAFVAPQVITFTRKSGDEQVNEDASVAAIDTRSCGSPLPPNRSCPVQLTLRGWLWPGEHLVDVGVGRPGGGWAQRTQTIRVRASWFLTFVLIVVGAGAGWYVQGWRSRGARAVAALMDIARLRQTLTRVVELRAEGLGPILRRVGDEIDDAEGKVRANADATADIEQIRLWIRPLAATAEILLRLNQPPVERQAVLAARCEALLQLAARFRATAAEQTQRDALIQALVNDLNAWPRLAATINDAAGLGDAVDSVLRAAAGIPYLELAAVREQREALNQAIAAAKAPLPADNLQVTPLTKRQALQDAQDGIAQALKAAEEALLNRLRTNLEQERANENDENRKKRLQTLIDRIAAIPAEPSLGRTRAVATLFRTAVGAHEAAPAPAQIAVPGGVGGEVPSEFFIPPSGTSLIGLQARQRWNDLLTNLIVLLATGLAGVLALWVPNATWGSVGDMIGAVLAGFGTRLAVGAVGSATNATGNVQ
jgi:hypothetical protein